MRYPRAFFTFDKQLILPEEKFFKEITNASRSAYLSGASKPIGTLDNEVNLIIAIERCFNNAKHERNVVVLSHPKIFDFLLAYFSDKNYNLYWIDDKKNFEKIYIAHDALTELSCMDSFLYDAAHAYSHAYSYFYHLAKRDIHPRDEVIEKIQAFSYGEARTVLESELRVLLTSYLSINVINRFDL